MHNKSQRLQPLDLLERILQASSNPEDIVLDPFCGCGTASAACCRSPFA
jgi:DNA modification methylase